MKRCAIAIILLGVMFAGLVSAAPRGAEKISIDGGQSGQVPFPHLQHQDRIGDCKVCHDAFPQEAGAIQRMKEQGALQPKKVMNLQCIRCHKADKQAGKPHGPLTCKTCHVK